MENVSELPSGSLAVGVKLYVAPTFTAAAGLPLIVGGPPETAVTAIANAGSAADKVPSLTRMMILG